MRLIEMLRSYAAAGAVVILTSGGAALAQSPCVADCDGNGIVSINELILAVNISLEEQDLSVCPSADSSGDGIVAINELIQAVNSSLDGCTSDCGDCSDGDACTTDACDSGQCVNDPVVCQDDGNECTVEACDPASGCGSSDVEDGTSCDGAAGSRQGGAGSCQGGVCVAFECVVDADCDDGNACTTNSCADNSCVSSNEDDGTSCDGGTGACQSGVCLPAAEVEYQQNFESLDQMSDSALADDGWVVFGNVFDGVTGRYRYGYGAFPAPNGGDPGFSHIDTGQGGPEQGAQQLAIFSDYNNMDHANGDLIESNVFRERRVTAEDVGNTITFSFDAKRGNINDPADPLCPCTSTAAAFIKTLNPAAGFATTNLVEEETTEIPDTWDRYTLTLAIDAGLEGQLLQVGFTTDATLYQPSAIFYDNIEVSSSPTGP